jgi:NADH pyrophosphatase NudC (nudix superfamily)
MDPNPPILDRPYLRCCPKCSSGDLVRPIVGKLVCRSCGFELYFNAAASVIAFITDSQGRLLVTRRARDPGKGALGLPGGFIDLDESAEQAVTREVKEETGLHVTAAVYLCSAPNTYPYKGVVYKSLDLAFACKVGAVDAARAADDVAELHWRRPEEIDPAEFAFESMAKSFRAFMRWSENK